MILSCFTLKLLLGLHLCEIRRCDKGSNFSVCRKHEKNLAFSIIVLLNARELSDFLNLVFRIPLLLLIPIILFIIFSLLFSVSSLLYNKVE